MSANVTQIAAWQGFCLACSTDDRPLTLLETGGRGLRAWLAGTASDDRTLVLTCCVCGHVEPIFATDEEDEAYDATLARWPDAFVEEVRADVWRSYDPEPVYAELVAPAHVELPAQVELAAPMQVELPAALELPAQVESPFHEELPAQVELLAPVTAALPAPTFVPAHTFVPAQHVVPVQVPTVEAPVEASTVEAPVEALAVEARPARHLVVTVRLAAPRVSATDAFPLTVPVRVPAAA